MRLLETIRRHWGASTILVTVLALAAWMITTQRVDVVRAVVIDYGGRIPVGWFVVALLVLPLVGFPFGLLLLVAGLRFGLTMGMIIAGVGVLLHHLVAYRIARGWLHQRLQAWLGRRGYAIPHVQRKHQVWLTAMVAVIHGLPYAPKLYLLALTNVPFRIYFGVGAPIYIVFCLIPVAAGSAVQWFQPAWIYSLIAISTLMLVVSYWCGKHYQRRTQWH